jgi:hypothetical protein
MQTGISPYDLSRNWESAARLGFGMGETALGRRLLDAVNNGIDFAAEHSLRLLSAVTRWCAARRAVRFLRRWPSARRSARATTPAPTAARVQEILQNFEDYPHLADEAENHCGA